jgi:hypothetical protein
MERRLLIQYDCNLQDAKNKDYGGAYFNDLDKYGLVPANILIDHKLNRLEHLLATDSNVLEESPFETWIDLVNYSVMTVNYLSLMRPKSPLAITDFKTALNELIIETGHMMPVQHCRILADKMLNLYIGRSLSDLHDVEVNSIITYLNGIASVALAQCLAFDDKVLHEQYLS